MSEAAQKGANEGGFASAEIAIQPDHHAGLQNRRERLAKRDGCGFVRKRQAQQGLFVMRRDGGTIDWAKLRAMQAKHSDMTKAGADQDGLDAVALVRKIKTWGRELGFAELGIARADVSAARAGLMRWLDLGRHGEMDYMAKHAVLRAQPETLVPGALSVISARLPYWPQAVSGEQVLADRRLGYISRYALGRDYHKTVRQRLQKLADRIGAELRQFVPERPFSYRVFSDSAPVMEVEFARQSGLAWRGKHTLSLTREGSWHFLGEIYTDLPLTPDAPIGEHCGTCRRCLDACPTAAIVAPYEVDARLCISYLTIELKGAIPVELRPLIGNRIYGCDDCQLCCPWNDFAHLGDPDFAVRHGLDAKPLAELFAWTEQDFDERLSGSPIRRIGHERWLRNIAVALGNAGDSSEARAVLAARRDHPSALVREHVAWALAKIITG